MANTFSQEYGASYRRAAFLSRRSGDRCCRESLYRRRRERSYPQGFHERDYHDRGRKWHRGFCGDGGPATDAALQIEYLNPTSGLAVDLAGNLYIADSWNNRVRKVSNSGIITTIAGGGGSSYGDGGLATNAKVIDPAGLAFDSGGNLYISQVYTFGCVVRKVAPNGLITTVAGTSNCGYAGDGGPAASALLSDPEGLAVDSAGNLYIAGNDGRVRKVAPNGIITTVAGNGNSTYDGDGGPATSFSLNYPFGVVLDGAGNLYIADANNHRIREVSADGTITTIAGNGNYGFAGDGGAATNAELSQPDAIAIDSAGNLYFWISIMAVCAV